ncbi:MAG: sulfotransferase [Opitutus sp.]|nr:sulfotransferase [Opitutus sp.]MCS6248373.1 sulfotransferase [Opitutus sp.]MCS6274297.1 sulfotransferase [Opitutus sp.]MCS6278606.1 sulfotransferase [Opitutus sp.]
MQPTPFLVTGMFRSGTTLAARMLHANRHVICASDPYAPIFKLFRNHFGRRLRPDFDPESPLHDYYFDAFQHSLFQALQASDFEVPVDAALIADAVARVRRHSTEYSPLIHPLLPELTGRTFAELLRAGLGILEKAYPKSGARALGFKEVWVGEFTPQFLTLAPGSRVVHIVRDPRAVVASNYVSGARYPLLFLIRQWRKQATLAWLYAQRYPERVLVLKFEDMVSESRATAEKLCRFLGVEFDPAMIDPSCLKDGANQPWTQNTSYTTLPEAAPSPRTEGFNRSAVEKWRSALPESYLRVIDRLTCFEMKSFGYEPLCPSGPAASLDMDLLLENDPTQLSDWIKPYSQYDYFREMLEENARHQIMGTGRRLAAKAEARLALDSEAYAHLTRA